MAAKKKVSGILEAIEVEPLMVGSMRIWIKGRTPLICNRMSSKGAREILFPSGPKGKAEKEQSLKHDPMNEYRNSMRVRAGNGETRIVFPAPAIKGAMATAALETKGTNRTQIGRLVWVDGYDVDVYGVPQVFMAMVRQADKNHTPDIRTRAIIPEWAVPVTIHYIKPQLNEKSIMQLLANGGIIIGIGDFRQEKGKGSFGQFSIVTEAECRQIVKAGGLKTQDAAIRAPSYFDSDTAELMEWFLEEVKQRGKQSMLAKQ